MFIDFYGHLAELLAARGKVLSIATGIGDIDKEDRALGMFVAQPFEIARGHANVIMRPMCYDMFQFTDDHLEAWRAHIVDDALDTVGLDPGQFQLGLKTSSNVDPERSGMTRSAGWSPRKCCLDAHGVADLCKRVLRPRNVGVVTFAGFTDTQTIDAGLNAGAPPAGTAGEPVQQPLRAALGGRARRLRRAVVDPEAGPRLGRPGRHDQAGITTPADLVKWMRATSAYSGGVDDEGNWVVTRGVPRAHARALVALRARFGSSWPPKLMLPSGVSR